MFKESNCIDLSLVKNQNYVAVIFAELLSLSILESVDLNTIYYDPRNSIILEKYDSETKLLIINKFDNNLKRYLFIFIDKSDSFHSEIKCVCRKKNRTFIDIIVYKAINYLLWGNKYTRQIRNNHIMDNYAKKVYNIFDKGDTKELYNIINIISNDRTILSENKYKFEYNINDTNKLLVSIISFDSGLLKFSIIQNDKEYYIYFTRNRIGLTYLCLEIERILYKIKSI